MLATMVKLSNSPQGRNPQQFYFVMHERWERERARERVETIPFAFE